MELDFQGNIYRVLWWKQSLYRDLSYFVPDMYLGVRSYIKSDKEAVFCTRNFRWYWVVQFERDLAIVPLKIHLVNICFSSACETWAEGCNP